MSNNQHFAALRVAYTRSTPHTNDTRAHSDATDYVTGLQNALYRIATTPIEPRPDGTHNISRAALIQIARHALERHPEEEASP